MAITSAIMQMRRGNEIDFDPDKMHPGEWAVSTDTKYVRMCFSPGVCVRMATYEAFEEDMEQIIAILEEAKTVQEAIEEIYKEFQEAELDIEAAENSAILSESYAHGGTNTREGEDTDNAKYYAELAKENIEPVMNAVSDIALNRKTLGYVKKNLLKNTATTQTIRGVTFTVNNDGSITVNGTSDKSASGSYFELDAEFVPPKTGKYILSGCPSGGSSTTFYLALYDNTTLSTIVRDVGSSKDIELDVTHTYKPTISVLSGTTVENLTFYPMIRSADVEDDTYEPYVDDVNTRLENVETEVIPIERGGTGGTTAKEAQYNLLKDMNEVAETISDETRIMFQYGSPSQSLGGAYYRKAIYVWNYIKSKLGGICNRTVKSANATTHSNYPTDNDKIPDMSFMSYWNGAYGDGGGSNLTYCKFGAFGTMATKNVADYTPVANLVTTVAGKPLDATMGKTLNDKVTAVETKQGGCYLKYENGKFYIGYDDNVTGV